MILEVLLGLAATAGCIICSTTGRPPRNLQASESKPRTLYGSHEEKLVQMQAYHKLKGSIKAEARECHRRSLCLVANVLGTHTSTHLRHFLEKVAQLPGSLLVALAKGWLGQDCRVAYRSCDIAKAYTKRIITAMLEIDPPPPDEAI